MQKPAATTNGSAPGATFALHPNSNNLLESNGEKILAAARVDVNKPRLRERFALLDVLATRAAVDVSAMAAPARFIM